MSEHTETPWRVGDTRLGIFDGIIYADTPNLATSFCIAKVFQDEQVPGRVREANAEFIVRACNMHGELTEKLQEAKEYLMDVVHETVFQQGDTSTTDNVEELIFNIEQALKQAGVE